MGGRAPSHVFLLLLWAVPPGESGLWVQAEGNRFFKNQQWREAIDKYEEAVGLLRYLKNRNLNWRKEGLLDKDITLVEDYGDRASPYRWPVLARPEQAVARTQREWFALSLSRAVMHADSLARLLGRAAQQPKTGGSRRSSSSSCTTTSRRLSLKTKIGRALASSNFKVNALTICQPARAHTAHAAAQSIAHSVTVRRAPFRGAAADHAVVGYMCLHCRPFASPGFPMYSEHRPSR